MLYKVVDDILKRDHSDESAQLNYLPVSNTFFAGQGVQL